MRMSKRNLCEENGVLPFMDQFQEKKGCAKKSPELVKSRNGGQYL